jgi:hypothetical protein
VTLEAKTIDLSSTLPYHQIRVSTPFSRVCPFGNLPSACPFDDQFLNAQKKGLQLWTRERLSFLPTHIGNISIID